MLLFFAFFSCVCVVAAHRHLHHRRLLLFHLRRPVIFPPTYSARPITIICIPLPASHSVPSTMANHHQQHHSPYYRRNNISIFETKQPLFTTKTSHSLQKHQYLHFTIHYLPQNHNIHHTTVHPHQTLTPTRRGKQPFPPARAGPAPTPPRSTTTYPTTCQWAPPTHTTSWLPQPRGASPPVWVVSVGPVYPPPDPHPRPLHHPVTTTTTWTGGTGPSPTPLHPGGFVPTPP